MVKKEDACKWYLTPLISSDIKALMSPSQVKRIRMILGLTQQQLADIIGASQVSVARWETGVQKPHGANLKILKELAQKAAGKKQ